MAACSAVLTDALPACLRARRLRPAQLRDSKAADVCERLEDFVSYCAPPAMDGDFTVGRRAARARAYAAGCQQQRGPPHRLLRLPGPQEFRCGDIVISNTAHPLWTEVTITAELFSPGGLRCSAAAVSAAACCCPPHAGLPPLGLLLELSSIIHGQGLSIAEAVVRGGSESPIPPGARVPGAAGGCSCCRGKGVHCWGAAAACVAGHSILTWLVSPLLPPGSLSHRCAIPEPPPGKRVMRFWLTDSRSGLKLVRARAGPVCLARRAAAPLQPCMH